MQSQRGITITGFIFFTIIFVYGGILGMRFVPIYLQNYTMKKSIESFSQLPKKFFTGSASTDIQNMRNRFMNQLSVDGIEDIPRDALQVTPKNSSYLVSLNYERRVPLVANIDAVVHFELQQTVSFSAE